MTLFKEDDVFGYKDANGIKKFWASPTEPDPSEVEAGEIYLNTGSLPYKLKRCDGAQWELIGTVALGDSDPAAAVSTGGQLFLNASTTLPKLKRFNGSVWQDIALLGDAEVLNALKNVDGPGSGLDADTVDGIQASSFVRSDTDSSFSGTLTSTIGGETVVEFSGADSRITIHDGYGNFNFLSGVDDDNIITGVDGGTRIFLNHNGAILLSTSSQAVGTAFQNTSYISMNADGIYFYAPVTVTGRLVIPTGTPSSPVNGSIWL
jgi:hypothetical protein